MDLPAGYTARPATHDDVPGLFALICEVDVEEYGAPDYDESDLRDDFARDRLDLARDTWVVVAADGSFAGFGIAWDKRPHSLVMGETAVRPDGPDLYPWLVGAISRRAAEHAAVSGRAVAHLFNSEPNARRAAAITAAGYEHVRVFRRMEVALDAAPPAPAADVVRLVTPDDIRTVWEVQQESFADHYDFVPMPYDAWHRQFVATESYRPDLWWLAEEEGRVTGVLLAQAFDGMGWVKTVGVLPSARGRGIATALLRTAFGRFRDVGFPRAGLGVDSDNATGAMALYERLGMTATRRYDLYERLFTST